MSSKQQEVAQSETLVEAPQQAGPETFDQSRGNAAAQDSLGPPPEDDSIGWGENSKTARVRASTNRYTVKKGDTLSGIAAKAGQADYQPLYDLNRDSIDHQDKISAGQVLVVPVGWAIPGMTDDPNNLVGDPLAFANTEYESPTVDMGVQVAADGSTSSPSESTGALVAGAKDIKIVTGVASPIVKKDGTAPTKEQLWVEEAGGTHITDQQGTVADPSTMIEAVDDSLFIDSAPDSADVRQGAVGDCFFLAVLLGLVAGDPAAITDNLSMSGERAKMTFKRQDGANWVDVDVTVTNDLLVSTGTYDLRGAGFRVASEPEQSEWWADVVGSTLMVSRYDTFEVALWVPLIEKAYARFSEQYGKYGTGVAAGDAGKGGMEIIDGGGAAEDVYQIFYGGTAANAEWPSLQYAADDTALELLNQNTRALELLLDLRDTGTDTAPGDSQQFIQVRVGEDTALTRLEGLITSVKEAQDDILWFWETDNLSPALDGLQTDIDAYQADNATDADGDGEADNLTTLLATARAVVAPGTHPELWEQDDEHKPHRDLVEVALIAANLGTDAGPGQRTVYASHAYNILSVDIRGADGSALTTVNSSNVAAEAAKIDIFQSTVQIQNPHATNEPDLAGDGADDGVDEGTFSFTLDQLFRNFDLLRACTVTH